MHFLFKFEIETLTELEKLGKKGTGKMNFS